MLCAAVAGVYVTDRLFIAPQTDLYRQVAEQKSELARLREENQRLEVCARLLAVVDRSARIEVLEQRRGEDGLPRTRILFTETDPAGMPVDAGRAFVFSGREIYVDALAIRFEEQLDAGIDALKGQAVVLFRRLTNAARPGESLLLDPVGTAPQVYAGDESPTAFANGVWGRVWALAANPAAPPQPGLRLIHVNTPYTRLDKGRTYQVTLRRTGEVGIRPVN